MKIDWKYIIKIAAIIAAILVVWFLGNKALDTWKDNKAEEVEAKYQNDIAKKDSLILELVGVLDSTAIEKSLLRDTILGMEQGLHRKDKRLDSLKNWQYEKVNRSRKYNTNELTDAFTGWKPR